MEGTPFIEEGAGFMVSMFTWPTVVHLVGKKKTVIRRTSLHLEEFWLSLLRTIGFWGKKGKDLGRNP